MFCLEIYQREVPSPFFNSFICLHPSGKFAFPFYSNASILHVKFRYYEKATIFFFKSTNFFLNLLVTSNTIGNFFQIFVVFIENLNFIACYWLSSFSSWCAKKQAFLFFQFGTTSFALYFWPLFFPAWIGIYFLWLLLFFKYFKQGRGYWSNWGNRNQILQAVQVVGISYFMCARNSLCNGAKTFLEWNFVPIRFQNISSDS